MTPTAATTAAARRLRSRSLPSYLNNSISSLSSGYERTIAVNVIGSRNAKQTYATGRSRPIIIYHHQQQQHHKSFFSPSISRYGGQQWLSNNFSLTATKSCSFSTGVDASDPSSSTTTTTDSSRTRIRKSRSFSTGVDASDPSSHTKTTTDSSRISIRLSKLISRYASNMTLSRSQADKLIKDGQVTMFGQVVTASWTIVDLQEILPSSISSSSSSSSKPSSSSSSSSSTAPVFKVKGKPIFFSDELFSLLDGDDNESNNNKNSTSSRNVPHVWAVHKVEGEVVSERDPQGRPSLIDRLQSSGVGKIHSSSSKSKGTAPVHLKPIGRLDMMTEGLMLVTNSGEYAREMELPKSHVHRVYRARVHGQLTVQKLDQIRYGRVPILKSENSYDDRDYHHSSPQHWGGGGGGGGGGRGRSTYAPMKVVVEKMKGKRGTAFRTNTWLRITSTDGKNRQIRNVFASLGMTVTRLIRIQYGDYRLDSIPRGIAIPVPYKPLDRQKAVGKLQTKPREKAKNNSSSRGLSPGREGRTRNTHGGRSHADADREQASPVRWVTSVS